ncbi:hypothetical protein [Mesonia mobilis]|uniref:Uncharacterized protein n=1 Tax=Mesonia mobilis TaxID=369791 RepID=A0ABQ3C659_9FLAO|nr:hypothetical protein [Mesonia mobilis]MBQ0737234.1 hypothetical protein [Aquimarina celericrescens]GGZ63472.1 hypothetical protein GCM10008088_26130 [Mesonia mobilis]
MIGIVFIYFVGKKFYTLAEEKNKKKWPYAILGVLSYYFGLVTGGILLGILLEIFMPGTIDSTIWLLVYFAFLLGYWLVSGYIGYLDMLGKVMRL